MSWLETRQAILGSVDDRGRVVGFCVLVLGSLSGLGRQDEWLEGMRAMQWRVTMIGAKDMASRR